jgi:hypothetical protein
MARITTGPHGAGDFGRTTLNWRRERGLEGELISPLIVGNVILLASREPGLCKPIGVPVVVPGKVFHGVGGAVNTFTIRRARGTLSRTKRS